MAAITETASVGGATEPPEKPLRETRSAILMVSPAMILLALFVVVPFVMAFWLSLHNVKLDSARPSTWMGLEQYRRILFDPDLSSVFYRSLLNNFLFADGHVKSNKWSQLTWDQIWTAVTPGHVDYGRSCASAMQSPP